jgi:AcrR family transcriptional regulator
MMSRMSRSAEASRKDEAMAVDPRARVLQAAEACIMRHGIRKTTMEDIANEAGMSRPTVYRYFADRDDLLIALISTHSRSLLERAHRYISKQRGLANQIAEGLLYLADHGRRDPFTRYLVNLDGTDLSRRMATSRANDQLTAEFWDRFLDEAQASGELAEDLRRPDAHFWLGRIGLMLMVLLDEDPDGVDRYRAMVRRFVTPAFVT